MQDAAVHRFETEAVIAHSLTLAENYRRLTGRDLLPGVHEPRALARGLYEAPFVVVSHGTEADPVLNYGNAAAQELWEMSWEELTRTPSRLTAEAPERAERERLLAAVRTRGFIDDYSGVRISSTGRRFRIERATVWNLEDGNGVPCGQAACFREWTWLPDSPPRGPSA
jgi:MEKHLA domain